MNKHHPYNNIIERKLGQLPIADADHLWSDMHAILDKKMPEEKERRRFIFWLLNGRGLLVIIFVLLSIATTSMFIVSGKKNSPVVAKNIDNSVQHDKVNRDGIVQPDPGSKETTTRINELDKNKNNENLLSPRSANTNNHGIVNYIVSVPLTTHQAKRYSIDEQFNEPVRDMSVAMSEMDIAATIDLNSRQVDLEIGKEHNKEIDSLIKEAGLAAPGIDPYNKRNNQRGIYAGIISGIDLSSIRFRSAKTGSTKGFVIGYALSKKWSIESGLLWDTKRVYDDGRYFNPPGYTPTSGVIITEVNGKSRIYEVPVNLKYTIVSGKNILFATTGLSSYFMRSENYDYEYKQNNQPAGRNYLSYKNETKNLFSVANVSVGYEHKLGAAGSLRVEPYLKLPIKNIGVGNMPIMSTGLNVGFIKKIK